MAVAMTLKEYLDTLQAHYDVVEHARSYSALETAESAHIPGDRVAKPVLLGDDHSYLLVVIPATYRLEVDRLNQATARHLELISEEEIESAFADCQSGAIPAIGEAYGIDTVVESEFIGQEDVYFESGDHEHLIHMSGEEFRRVMSDVPRLHLSHHL